MIEIEDWLQDPLMENRDYRKLKSHNTEQYEKWRIFHYATIVKLGGANFFCTKVIDTARTPDDLQLRWYLDAFFFELKAAYDTLLQELNGDYILDTDTFSWYNTPMMMILDSIYRLFHEQLPLVYPSLFWEKLSSLTLRLSYL